MPTQELSTVLGDLTSGLQRIVWGPVMIVLLMGAGVYFSLGTGFMQLRSFGLIVRKTLGNLFAGRGEKTRGISPFAAVSTALASTVGTGNIVGVAAALTLGGPGAIFWMWVSAFLGMMTKYAEVVLAQKFRRPDGRGGFFGGPMYAMRDGLGRPGLAGLYATLCLLASMGVGNMVQSGAISETVRSVFPVSSALIGLIVTLLSGAVILGGVRSIARVTEKLVPFMALLYIGLSVLILFCQYQRILPALASIVREAFRFGPIAAGTGGYALSRTLTVGLARGVFSNEAGLGSASIAHAAADAAHPVEQGFWGAMEVFLDTIVICTITALVILCSGAYVFPGAIPPPDPLVIPMTVADAGVLSAAMPQTMPLTTQAFVSTLGTWGGILLMVCTVLFALATIIGWSFYGDTCCVYLFPKKQRLARRVYRLLYLVFVYAGAQIRVDLIWHVSDIFNGLLAIPNLISLFLLSGIVFSTTRAYRREMKP